MTLGFGLLRKALLGISPGDVLARYSPFDGERPGDRRHWERIDRIVKLFMHVYSSTLEDPALWYARFLRDNIVPAYRGFSVEGIGLGLAVVDMTSPFSRADRAIEFANDLDGRHRGLAYVGIGIGLGRLNRHPKWRWSKMHPELREFVLDGYGFSHGLFKRKKFLEQRQIPRRLAGRDLMMFDQGLGRWIWVMSGGDADALAATLSRFGAERERALWGGVGIACSYAGPCDRSGYEKLRQLAGDYYPALARGCAMACYQTTLDQYIADHSEMAARELWDASVVDVAERVSRHLKSEGCASAESPMARLYDQLERDALARISQGRRRAIVPSAAREEIA